jgi:hypothetical protein
LEAACMLPLVVLEKRLLLQCLLSLFSNVSEEF